MTVYVDDMYLSPMGKFGRMKMSHLMSDESEEELLQFVDKLGLNRKWIQHVGEGRAKTHFDIAMTMRAKAVAYGAVECTMRELAAMTVAWRKEDVE